MIYLRIISLLFLLAGSIFLPLPVVLVVFVLCSSFFQSFWEGVLVGFLLDAVYPQVFVFDFNFSFFSLSFVVFILLADKMKNLIHNKGMLSRLIVSVCGGLFFYFIFLLVS
ncbi:MAG: hypothetical protein K9M15_02610 [Candidatus Marinimicrobia bacterium]|nr:hypothetical protein [Candidatus Neomarinimicrobiota bacterium]